MWPAALRYWGLVGVLLAGNYAVLSTLTGLGLPLLPAKLLTEIVLFGASYLIQRAFVFARPRRSGPAPATADREGVGAR